MYAANTRIGLSELNQEEKTLQTVHANYLIDNFMVYTRFPKLQIKGYQQILKQRIFSSFWKQI